MITIKIDSKLEIKKVNLEKIKELNERILKGIDIILEDKANNDRLMTLQKVLHIEESYLELSNELINECVGMISTILIHKCETCIINKNILSIHDDYICNKHGFQKVLPNEEEIVDRTIEILSNNFLEKCDPLNAEYIYKLLRYHQQLNRLDSLFSSIEQDFKNYSVKHYIEKE